MNGYPEVPARWDEEPADELVRWALAELAAQGYVPGEPEVVRRRPWSIVLRVPTDRGTVWLKGNARPFGYEAAMLSAFDRWAPEHVLPLIAARPERGWLMLPDGGEVLASTGPPDAAEQRRFVIGYADLQRRLAPHVEQLLAAGLPDCRPAALPSWYRRVLDRAAVEPHVRSLLPDGDWAALTDLAGATAAWAAELGRSRVPASVDHNDLHAHNVFVGTAAVPGLRLFDWGDACVTHPFVGLRRLLRTAVGGQDDELPQSGTAAALLDTYLRAWTPDGEEAPAGWRREVELATAMSYVVVAASWLRLPTFDRDWGGYFASFLTSYLARARTLLDAG